jgi:hypothetical protein
VQKILLGQVFTQYFSFPCQYHSTNVPHSFIDHRRCIMLFSQYFNFPCQYHSTNVPHSFIYHRSCIMLFSQYFSFPCQYHSTNAPYSLIHLPPTLYNVSLPVLQFSPVSIIPLTLHTHPFMYHRRCITTACGSVIK